MQVTGTLHGMTRSGAKPRLSRALGVGKSSASGHLGTGAQGAPQQRNEKRPRLQVELVCQDDTRRFDPFWDGPRLKPVFVAQLLGQVMPGERVMATNAYGKTAPRMALLVDRKD
jgi:hypothetical protein